MTFRTTTTLFLVTLLAACSSVPTADIRRNSDPSPPAASDMPGTEEDGNTRPQPMIRRGSGQVINESALAPPPPPSEAGSGMATFNFEGESLQGVVKAILGEMLGQNYFIAAEVQGSVTLATPNPVSPGEAMRLLEMVLAQNNARLVYSGGRYNVVPAEQGMNGNVAPRTGSAARARGYEVRVVPLRYIGAEEMKKVLEPYTRSNAVVAVDQTRNLITLGGTAAELENYLRTVQVFDVDWLSGMSVGVFPLQSGRAGQVAADLEKVFGDSGKTPSAGMFRFLPLEAANAVLVITPQATYLDQIQQWLDRIDSAGVGSRLYSYELKYIKARDLAERLAEVYGAGNRSVDAAPAALAPGATPVQLDSGGLDSRGGTVGFGRQGMGGGVNEGMLQLSPATNGNASLGLDVDGDRVGVSAVEETNSLLVRARPGAWRSIREVIDKLDVMPLQVHIEAQVAEVKLTGELSYGVNWYFENAVTAAPPAGPGLPSALGRDIWGDIAGSITGNGLGWTFLGRNAAAVISALDRVTDVQLLQTPSVVVRNNAEATFIVGSQIPVTSVSVMPGTGESRYTQVQYLDTGIILKVRPRVTRDGMVFLDIVQEVSTPGSQTDADENGNVRIDTRRLKTEAAIRAGDTIMLAGLISQGQDKGSSGVPGLSRLPVVGGLFGRQVVNDNREEVIVLLTPTVIRNPQEAAGLTDEYGRGFRALQPLPRR
ncbi:type II secretion system secretin GspD [Pseudoxanthomonas suwonensis]|uniref:General secretion pathway protein GspD n=1 Tax=Pseudoxanthomonas suwonensis TaxID=314722 RepID=A0A0E3UPR7_9GAMM|nr:type II secretion system secretin GspD [Pseudoxanthomonas suwonensis]AKC88055.1 general secretion pathway protein GspD [Pseudoxanthomonas suwonensis]